MQGAQPSRTALSTALMRALHSRFDTAPLIDDVWGERLVGEAERETLRREAVARLDADDPRRTQPVSDIALFDVLSASPAFANVILRTRYTEDALQTAVSAGTLQYVLLGAGLDSFALRQPDWAQRLDIFEIDHPSTQRYKRQRLEELGVVPGPNVHFIAADLAEQSVAHALSRSAFRPSLQSFFSWLGVTMYLTREANLATLRSIAGCAPAGSRLSFTYLETRAFAESGERFRQIQARVSALGEPFLSGFDPQHLGSDLQALGLRLIDDVGGAEAAARFGRTFSHYSSSHIALAEVAAAPDAAR